jgi:high-affinity nickel-transport protein
MTTLLLRTLNRRLPKISSDLFLLYAALVFVNVFVWLWAWKLFGDRPALFSVAILAYTLGLRHAVDADHIAAIDNVVRKLMQQGQRPSAAGFYFSLGHSTVVIVAACVVALTTSAFKDELSALKQYGAVAGTVVSASFLLAIAALNVVILRSVWRTFNQVRRGERVDGEDGDHHHVHSAPQGLLFRMLAPLFPMMSRSWHMYPLGLLFGLGFDTATEISLLGISAAQAADGLSVWAVLAFPALFTAGMVLADTTDSVLMVAIYGWAFIQPIRKLWYNLTITAASVVAALFIGGVEAAGLVADNVGLEGGFWRGVAQLNNNLAGFGFAVIGIFVACWLLSAILYRWM